MKQVISFKDNERSKRYLNYHGIRIATDDALVDCPERPERVNDSLLDIIYALDPVTGLPSGDFVLYLGKDTSPEVRQYIQSQLLTELPRGTGVPVEHSDILFDYMRQQNEPIRDYVARITEFEKSRLNPKSE